MTFSTVTKQNIRSVGGIENRIYREELKESLGMNFFLSLSAWKGVQSVQIM